MLIDRKAEIGIVLLACNFPAFILPIMWIGLLPLPDRIVPAIVLDRIWVFRIVLTISGLIFYIVGRKRFLTRTRNHRIVPFLSLFLGAFLLVFGSFSSFISYGLIEHHHHKVAVIGIPYSDIFIREFPALLWFVLWTISGMILTIDSWKILHALDQKTHL
jgi:hypothetical protein